MSATATMPEPVEVQSNGSATPDSGFNFKSTKLAHIPIRSIRENAEALRVTVDKEDANYLMNLDSVKKRGIMNPILVREIKDPVSGETLYGLIDGLHRLNWAMDANMDTIPANIGSLAEADLLEAQIIANVARVETKAIQYTKALLRILGANPLLTSTELAARLSRDPAWLNNRLGLMKLNEDIQPLVDNGTLGLTNAYSLSKLPPEKQAELLNQAISQPPTQFCPMAEQLRKELATARREGRKAEVDKFQPNPRLQRMALIKDQQAFSAADPNNCQVILDAKANVPADQQTFESGIAYALAWCMHLDPLSLASDKAAWEAAKAQAAAEKQKKEQEKQAAKQKKEQETAAPAGALIDPFAKAMQETLAARQQTAPAVA